MIDRIREAREVMGMVCTNNEVGVSNSSVSADSFNTPV